MNLRKAINLGVTSAMLSRIDGKNRVFYQDDIESSISTSKIRGRGHFTLLLKGKKVIGCYRADYSGTGKIKRVHKSDDRCCHSEIKFLKDNRYRKNLNKYKIINVKIKKIDGCYMFSVSKPCTQCKETLDLYGIKGIYYFTDETTIVYEDLKEMDTIPSTWNKMYNINFRPKP